MKMIIKTTWTMQLPRLILAFAALAPIASAQDVMEDVDAVARTLLDRADEMRFPRDDFQVDIDVTNWSGGEVTDRRTYRVLSKGNENTIVMILEPASERGQMLLMKGQDLWLFMPDVAQPIRLGLMQRLTGQVANGDLARVNFSGDYKPRLLRVESIAGEDYQVLELNAVNSGVAYRRVLLWITKRNNRPYKAEFYSLSNRLMKTCTYENYRSVLGQIRPTRLVMVDALKSEERSILDYRDMKKRELPEKVFSKEYLKKIQ